jgi:hypothetical protein
VTVDEASIRVSAPVGGYVAPPRVVEVEVRRGDAAERVEIGEGEATVALR